MEPYGFVEHTLRIAALECYGAPKQTSEGIRGIRYHDSDTYKLRTWLSRIVVCYMCWFVDHSGLQCFTSGTWINYRWTATGDLPQCMEVCHRQYQRYVGGITVRHCYCPDKLILEIWKKWMKLMLIYTLCYMWFLVRIIDPHFPLFFLCQSDIMNFEFVDA